MLGFSSGEFEISNMVRAVMKEPVYNIQEQMSHVNIKVKILSKSQKEILEIKSSTAINEE